MLRLVHLLCISNSRIEFLDVTLLLIDLCLLQRIRLCKGLNFHQLLRDRQRQSFFVLLKFLDLHLEALLLQGIDRDLFGQLMQVNFFGIVVGYSLCHGSRFCCVPRVRLWGALQGSISVVSRIKVGLKTCS